MRISIRDICGTNTVTRDDGKKIHRLICDAWKTSGVIDVDFDNLVIASVSFLDEAIGLLARNHSKDELVGKLRLVNIDSRDKELLNNILLSRWKQAGIQKLPHSRS